MTVKSAKLTANQVEENVRMLVKTIWTGNGQPSLMELVRDQGKEIQALKEEILPKLKAIEEEFHSRNLAANQKEVDEWKAKYELEVKNSKEKREERVYWTRTVIALILAQLAQWGFMWVK